ncbi:MAG: DUF6298 domain-containing protein [Candidatus Jettenia sp.]|nr:DUF6298 domain-containing protein [Candidatus Jettenia sp.]
MTISVKYKLIVFIILIIMVGIYHAGCSSGSGNDAPVTVKAEKNKKKTRKKYVSGTNRLINGSLKVHPSNPRYFTDESGKAIYLTGSHTWNNFKDIGTTNPPQPFDYEAYLDFLQQYNHNFIRLWTWELAKHKYKSEGIRKRSAPFPWLRIRPEMALDGMPKFNLDTFNKEYFDRLRSRVIAARDRGIYVSIMFFEGHSIQFSLPPWRWDGHPFHKDNNVNGINGDPNGDGYGRESHTLKIPAITALQEAYVRRVIDTVNDLDNVLYEISNEDHADSVDWQYHMINFIHNYEKTKWKQHPVGMTTHRKLGNQVLFESKADWISPSKFRRENDPYEVNPPVAHGDHVSILDSDHIPILRNDHARDQRSWVWKSFTRGHNVLFMDPYLEYMKDRNYPKGSKPDPFYNPIRRNMGYTMRYANRMNLAAMIPHNELSSTKYCLANPGSEYLIYAPSGGTVDVDLSSTFEMFHVEWFNPRTDKAIPQRKTAGGDIRSFTAPFRGDAVLYLYR